MLGLLDLCSGVGMLGLSVELMLEDRAGIEASPVAYCENNEYARQVLASRMEDGSIKAAPILRDVTDLPLPSLLGLVGGVVAGFPCQPFAAIGKQEAAEDDRHLWPFIGSAISYLRPWIVFLENVPGLITAGDGAGLREVAGDLAALGYNAEWGCMGSGSAGADRRRDRWWCVAWAPDAIGKRLERLHDPGAKARAGVRMGRSTLPGEGDTLPQPCLHGIPDGVANRVERTGAVGNGVDPRVAIEAYGQLGARAGLWPRRINRPTHKL